MRLCLLGGFEAWTPRASDPLQFPTRKAEALLAYLCVRSEVRHRRDHLSTLLWGDVSHPQARHSLRQTLTDIRATLREYSHSMIEASSDAIHVEAPRVRVDVHSFERLVHGARTRRRAAMACALYRGDFLQGINVREPDFDTWLTAERARLRQLAIEAHERYLRLLIEANDVGGAIQAALRLIGLDPLQEWAHRALIRLYVERGQLAMAVAQYNQCEQIMASELGVEPEPETKRLRQELLRARAKATGKADVTAADGPRDAAGEPPPRRRTPGDAPAPLREEWHRRKRADHSPRVRDPWRWRTKGNG